MYDRILSNWALSICGPCSVWASNGSPSLRFWVLLGQLLDHRVVDLLLHEQPAARAAALALVQEEAEHGPVDRRVQVGVGEDDVGTLAAELERHSLERVGRALHDQLAGGALAGEGDLVHPLVSHQGRAGRLAEAGHDVDHARPDSRPRAPARPSAAR